MRLLHQVAQGQVDKEIAEALGVAEKTVRNPLTRVFEKLGVATRTEAALWYEQHRTTGE